MFTHGFVTKFGFSPYYGHRTALYKAMDACLALSGSSLFLGLGLCIVRSCCSRMEGCMSERERSTRDEMKGNIVEVIF